MGGEIPWGTLQGIPLRSRREAKGGINPLNNGELNLGVKPGQTTRKIGRGTASWGSGAPEPLHPGMTTEGCPSIRDAALANPK
jgi:hypothetical protein